MASQSKAVSLIEVEIGDEVFDLFKAPRKDSILVREQAEEIAKNVNYDLIAAQTSALSLALRVAYLGVARFPLLQVEVNRLSVNITKLSDQSVRVLQKFQRAAVSINQSYIAACKYLTTKKEKFALMEFGNLLEKSKEMEVAVTKLASAFEGSANEAQTIYEKVQNTIQVRDDTTAEIKKIKTELKKIEEDIDRCTIELKVAQERELEAAQKMGDIGRKLKNGLVSLVTFGLAKNTDELEFQKCYEDKVRIQTQLRELRVNFQKKLLEMLEQTAVIKPHEASEIKIDNSTLSALDCCVKGLRHTQATLASVAEFWQRISEMNSDFSPDKLKEHVAIIQEEDAEERFEMYNDDNFRIKIKRQQAAWVAMAIASNTCLESINTCNRELHIFIGEHYDPDGAMVKLQEIMGSFLQRTKDMVYALEVDNKKQDGRNNPAITSAQDEA